jgi:hypothetical protein
MDISKKSLLVGILIIIIAVGAYFAFSGKAVVDPSIRSCIDSDSGEERYIKGGINYTSGGRTRFYNDKCIEPREELKEYYCNRLNEVRTREFLCAHGCDDGACLRREVAKCEALGQGAKAKANELLEQGKTVVLKEGAKIYSGDNVLIRDDDKGGSILRLNTIILVNTSYEEDLIIFKDVSSEEEYKAVISEKGKGKLTIGNKVYNILYSNLEENPYAEIKWSTEGMSEIFSLCI